MKEAQCETKFLIDKITNFSQNKEMCGHFQGLDKVHCLCSYMSAEWSCFCLNHCCQSDFIDIILCNRRILRPCSQFPDARQAPSCQRLLFSFSLICINYSQTTYISLSVVSILKFKPPQQELEGPLVPWLSQFIHKGLGEGKLESLCLISVTQPIL